MRKALIVLPVLLLLMAASPRGIWVGDAGESASRGISAPASRGAVAAPETTMWVFKTMWDTTSVAGTHSSPYYEGEGDHLVQDTDGSLFKYGHVRQDAATTVQYSSSANRVTMAPRDGAYPNSGARTMFYVWPLDQIPQGTEIIEAKLTFQVTVGLTALHDTSRIVAVIDTSSANYANYVSGAIQSGNPSYHRPAWDFAVGSTPWSWDLDNGGANDRLFSDFGIACNVIRPGDAASSNWWEADLTPIVQKYVDLGLVNKPIWFFGDGYGSSNATFYWNIGPNSTSWALEPVLTVRTTTKNRRAAFKFAVFSDNHSNSVGVGRMAATMDGAGFVPDFIVHNGDMNFGTNCDSVRTLVGLDSVLTDIPVAWGNGNHELSATCAKADVISQLTIPGRNKTFMNDLHAMGGRVTNFGPKTTIEKRLRTYSFDIGQVHIVLLDLQNDYSGIPAYTAADSIWLYRDLTASSQPKKIAICHNPLFYDYTDLEYPASSPDEGIDPPTNAEGLMATLEDCGVDAYIAGHAHLSWYGVRNGVLYVHLPSTKADKVQGFSTFDVSETGAVTVKFYRGVQDDATWELKHTTTF